MAYRIENKLTFMHIGKTAGTSITKFFQQNYHTEFSGGGHDHWDSLPRQWRDNVFAVVRNPYDRAVSYWTFITRRLEKASVKHATKVQPLLAELNKGFRHFVLNCQHLVFSKRPDEPSRGTQWWKETQLRQLPQDLKRVRLLRMETLQQDFKNLMLENGFGQYELPHLNQSSLRSGYRDHYDEETKAEVEKYYRDDIQKLGYSF